MDRALLAMLIVYLMIGAVFAVSVLSGVTRRLSPETKKLRWAFWMTHAILFFRWTCGWLPILLHYGVKEWWRFIRS